MIKVLLPLAVCVCLLACQRQSNHNITISPPDEQIPPNTAFDVIAFGSCNKSYEPQVIWKDILANQPDLWIWGGDNIYGDTEDMRVMRAKYDRQRAHTEYKALLEACPVIGTWDDHDFGANNSGKEYPMKKESRDEMLRFLDVPSDREIWQREGAYDAYTYDSKGHSVKVILLDVRYFSDQAGQTADLLGAAQWQWLEGELESSAEINLIVTGIQFLAEDHRYEKWANFPESRQRMIDLIRENKVRNAIFLSGDRHLAEISKMEVDGLDKPLYDITSSGMTHSWESASETNQHRVSPLIGQKNFGIIKLDWDSTKPTITFEIRGLGNELYAREVMEL